jgi:hypothetical protein
MSVSRDPAAFRELVKIETDGGPRRLAEVLDPWQRADFEAMDRGWRRVSGQRITGPLRGWFERPRGHSKTSDIAVQVVWPILFSKRQVTGVAAAGDADQARLLRDAIARLASVNEWPESMLSVQRDRVVNPKTGSSLSIISSDAATSYGLLCDFIVADELTHWRSPDLWDSLASTAAKRSSCMLAVITNAGFLDGWQWKVRESFRTGPSTVFSRLDGCLASWISPAMLEEQKRLLVSPTAFERLWLNRWASGCGDALPSNAIDAALTLAGPAEGPEPGMVYTAGIDLGITNDLTAFVVVARHVGHTERVYDPQPRRHEPPMIALLREVGELPPIPAVSDYRDVSHPATGRTKLVHVRTWRAPPGGRVSLADVEREVLAFHQRFRLSAVAADFWQSEYLCQKLSAARVPVESVHFTGPALQSMATAVCEAFREKTIDLYPEPGLLEDLRSARIVEKQYGVRLEFPRGPNGHGDRGTALALALHACSRFGRGPAGPPKLDRAIVSYPSVGAPAWRGDFYDKPDWWRGEPARDLMDLDSRW